MPVSPNKLGWFTTAAVCLAVAGWLVWPDREPQPRRNDTAERSRTDLSIRPSSALDDAFAHLGGDAEVRHDTLEDLRQSLASLPPDAAAESIREFLRSGRDKDTGLPFEIGRGGELTGWPTYRVFLLDALIHTDPDAAVGISRGILASPTSPDEWAVALRNVGKLESAEETDSFLSGKTAELIANPDWQAEPSVGYLNAFDVLVHTGATDQTPLLSSLIQRKDRKDLAHAGFLTLDRLVQRRPTDMLERLADDTALQQSRPEMTAQQFARADLRDPRQREIVETWLLDPARTAAELRSFAGTYPNQNRFVSHNLLTSDHPVSATELAAHDREALEIVTAWEADDRFLPVRNHLRIIRTRLSSFVGKPSTSP